MKEILLACFTLYFFWGCSKENENSSFIDSIPIQLETVLPENLGGNGVRLLGRILHLSNEPVLEHGFVLYGFSDWNKLDSTIHKIEAKPQSGYNVLNISGLPDYIDGNYQLKYYARTKNSHYVGKTISFSYAPILVDAMPELRVSLGQEISIPGDFKNVDNTFRIYSHTTSSMDGNPIEYTISENKKTLRFKIPITFSHGDERYFTLSSHKYASTFLVKAVVIGSLLPLKSYQYYYAETIHFEGVNIGRNPKMPFYIIVGRDMFPYQSSYPIADLLKNAKGTSFRVGYYNGLDTVIFSSKLNLRLPPDDAFRINQAIAHPSSTVAVSAGELVQYIPLGENTTVGGKRSYLYTMWNSRDRLTIDDLPDGAYPVVFKNNVHEYTSKQKINVRKLKAESISPTLASYGERITLRGNFIQGQSYFVRADDYLYESVAQAGSLQIYVQNYTTDKFQVRQVGYSNEMGKETWVDTDLAVEFKPMTYTGFSPSTGSYDTKITLYGEGIRAGMIYMASQWISNVEGGPGYVTFYVPRYIMPGKHKISVYNKEGWLTTEQVFELK